MPYLDEVVPGLGNEIGGGNAYVGDVARGTRPGREGAREDRADLAAQQCLHEVETAEHKGLDLRVSDAQSGEVEAGKRQPVDILPLSVDGAVIEAFVGTALRYAYDLSFARDEPDLLAHLS